MQPTVVCFGELLLRLNAPGREQLLQTPRLQVYIAGAEANVAVSLAHFGHSTSMVSTVPESPLGAACISELRRHGVRTEDVSTGPGRLGLYFMTTGSGYRPSEILYDRADSAFARAVGKSIDWNKALRGAKWLHLSGITPALNPAAADATLVAARAASQQGVAVSFDCNYRAKLWGAWNSAPEKTLRELAGLADLVFADDRALALMLGIEASPGDRVESFRSAAERAFGAFPRLKHLATTLRIEHSVDHHEISAMLMTRERLTVTRPYALNAIVDRIGTGDAFAAGLLHARLTGLEDQRALDFALAATCLKHSIPGDFNLITVEHVEELLADRGFGVKR